MSVVAPAPSTASTARIASPVAARVVQSTGLSLFGLAAIALGHVALAFVAPALPFLIKLHALAALGVGVVVAARGPLHRVAYVVGYIAGAEVFWRMTKAAPVWEYGKYAVVAVLVVAIARLKTHRNLGLVAAYFGLLLPSAMLTVVALDTGAARELLSFNLSGPLALAACVVFFSNVRLGASEVHKTIVALVGPVISVLTLAFVSTRSVDHIVFTTQSNAVASGGFGPNQVSSVLGLGLLFTLWLSLQKQQPLRLRIPLLALAIGFAAQAALTFSRGGLVMAAAAAFVAALYLMRDRRSRVTLIVVGILLFVLGKYVIEPRLDEFTQGKLTERYSSTETSRRDKIVAHELGIFIDNPVMGVGPGVASTIPSAIGVRINAHTEVTRMLAEHGLLGLLSAMCLVLLGARAVRTARTIRAKALTGALLAWFALYLLVNAMRIVAPMFVFGLAFSIALSSRAVREGAKRTLNREAATS